jgi:hypothetical protein
MLYAAVAACLAMLATSGIVAWATAAPSSEPPPRGERELIADLDRLIARQLDEVKARLIP